MLLRRSIGSGVSQQINFFNNQGANTKQPLPADAELRFCFHDVFIGFYIDTGFG